MSEKIKFEQEFIIKASSKMLYNYISTPSAMSEWFAEDVNLKDGVFTFSWDGAEEQAKVISKVKGKCIRFRWLEEDDDEAYVELRIETDELTKEVALIVTDFAYEDELEEAKMLWESQISDLHHVIGV